MAAKSEASGEKSYLSRFSFYALPRKTGEVEEELKKLAVLVANAGGKNPRILQAPFAPAGTPDVIFEQEAPELAALETHTKKLTDDGDLQMWTKKMASLLTESRKHEIYTIGNPS